MSSKTIKILLNITLIISLLANSAGQAHLSYAALPSFWHRETEENTLRPIASSERPGKIKNELSHQLLPGAEQAIDLLGGTIPVRDFVQRQERMSWVLGAPAGLEIETTMKDNFSRGILSFTPEKKYIDNEGRLTAPGKGRLLRYFEYRVRPSWSVVTQLASLYALEQRGLKDKTVISVQLNISVPWEAFTAEGLADFLSDAAKSMLMVVLAYVSDRRINTKRTPKIIRVYPGPEGKRPEDINGRPCLRIEYGFADTENSEKILKALQYLHAIIYAYHAENANSQKEEVNQALKILYHDNFVKLARIYDNLRLDTLLKLYPPAEFSFKGIPGWRRGHLQEVCDVREGIEEIVSRVDKILASAQAVKSASAGDPFTICDGIFTLDKSRLLEMAERNKLFSTELESVIDMISHGRRDINGYISGNPQFFKHIRPSVWHHKDYHISMFLVDYNQDGNLEVIVVTSGNEHRLESALLVDTNFDFFAEVPVFPMIEAEANAAWTAYILQQKRRRRKLAIAGYDVGLAPWQALEDMYKKYKQLRPAVAGINRLVIEARTADNINEIIASDSRTGNSQFHGLVTASFVDISDIAGGPFCERAYAYLIQDKEANLTSILLRMRKPSAISFSVVESLPAELAQRFAGKFIPTKSGHKLWMQYAKQAQQTMKNSSGGDISSLINPRLWQDTSRSNLMVSLPISALRLPHKKDQGIGKFTYIAPFYRDVLKPDGIDGMIFLPHYAIIGESPYAPVCLYALNEDFIDWSEVKEVKENPHLLNQLVATDAEQDEIDYDLLRKRESAVGMSAYIEFNKKEIGLKTGRAKEYTEFVKINGFWLNSYARFTALHNLISGKAFLQWSAADIRKARVDHRFSQLVSFHKYAQWIAHKEQLEPALREVYNYGGIPVFDIPMFRAKDGSDVWRNKIYFKDVDDPQAYPGVVISKKNDDGSLRVEIDERWQEMALWNWRKLSDENFEFMLGPIRYWFNFGFAGARIDAGHFAYKFSRTEDRWKIEQLGSGDEPGDAYVEVLGAVFKEFNRFGLVEAYEQKEGIFSRNGFFAAYNAWKKISDHDDTVGETRRAPRFSDTKDTFIKKIKDALAQRPRFISFALGHQWGEPEPIKKYKLQQGRIHCFWRYRIPLPGDKQRRPFDAGPSLAQLSPARVSFKFYPKTGHRLRTIRSVYLAGDFNNWSEQPEFQMKKELTGPGWNVTVELRPGLYQYKFKVSFRDAPAAVWLSYNDDPFNKIGENEHRNYVVEVRPPKSIYPTAVDFTPKNGVLIAIASAA